MAARAQRFVRLLYASLPWLVLLGCLGAELARGDDVSTVPLDLQAGATCLQGRLLRESLGGWLNQPVESAVLTVQIRGSAEDPRSATIVLLRAGQPLSQRAFSPGPSRCSDFHDAVALAIALMLKNANAVQSSSRVQPTADLSSLDLTEQAPPRTPRSARVDAAPAPRERTLHIAPLPRAPVAHGVQKRELVFSTRAAAVFTQHVASSTAAGARVEVGVGSGARWSLRAGVLGLLSTTQVLVPVDGAKADGQVDYRTRPLLASLLGCADLFGSATLRVLGCAGVLAGRVRFDGQKTTGSDVVPASSVAYPALQAQLELALRLGRRGWAFLAVSPTYGLRQLEATALDSGGAVAAQEILPRLGALFALGGALDFSADASAPHGTNERGLP